MYHLKEKKNFLKFLVQPEGVFDRDNFFPSVFYEKLPEQYISIAILIKNPLKWFFKSFFIQFLA